MQSMQMKSYRVPLATLAQHVDPLDGALWGCTRITSAEVNRAVADNSFQYEPWDMRKDQLQGPQSRDFHIQRMAHFVAHGLPADEHSIRISLDQQPNGNQIGIDNGNHRIGAALIRGDPFVDALVYFFDPGDVHRLLPGAVEL
jgi:hypothetical protein